MINVTKTDLPELEKFVDYLKKIWSSRWITNNGEFVQLLERNLEEYLRINNLLLVANGTLALQLVLKAFELKGEVITTPFTFAATTNVILYEGLTPVFADIDLETYNIDPESVEKKITHNTCAILAVHVYGNPCNVGRLREVADKFNLKLFYDAAHAFSVEYDNQSILNYGDLSTLSFHATKLFHTIEGGAIIVKDNDLLEKMKLLRNFGIESEEEVILPGINAKMNEFQAIMGLCNLESIAKNIELRKNIYNAYTNSLMDVENIKFQKIIASKYNYGYMPVCFDSIDDREEIYFELRKNGIAPRKYFYPLTVNYRYFSGKEECLAEKYNLNVASYIADRILCLPIYPDLAIESVETITGIIKKVLKRKTCKI